MVTDGRATGACADFKRCSNEAAKEASRTTGAYPDFKGCSKEAAREASRTINDSKNTITRHDKITTQGETPVRHIACSASVCDQLLIKSLLFSAIRARVRV